MKHFRGNPIPLPSPEEHKKSGRVRIIKRYLIMEMIPCVFPNNVLWWLGKISLESTGHSTCVFVSLHSRIKQFKIVLLIQRQKMSQRGLQYHLVAPNTLLELNWWENTVLNALVIPAGPIPPASPPPTPPGWLHDIRIVLQETSRMLHGGFKCSILQQNIRWFLHSGFTLFFWSKLIQAKLCLQ